MRHQNRVNKLGRTASHRKAMLSNMANSLILHKQIRTTLAKAKALRMYVEPLITKSKDDTTHSRRTVFSYLQQKAVLKELFGTIGPAVANRPGGYTRILKLGTRLGDNAELALIELVDFNEYLPTTIGADKAKTRRRRGGKKKAEGTAPKAEVATPYAEVVESKIAEPKVEVATVAEAPVVEAPLAPSVGETTEEVAMQEQNTAQELAHENEHPEAQAE